MISLGLLLTPLHLSCLSVSAGYCLLFGLVNSGLIPLFIAESGSKSSIRESQESA